MVATIESLKTMPVFIMLNITPEEATMLSEGSYPVTPPVSTEVFSYKCCPTRHGCSGATNCDSAYGDYHR